MILDIKKTITSIFMVPTLGIGKEKLKGNGFLNAYVRDEMRDVQYQNCIYLVFKPQSIYDFKEFLDNEYERTKSVIEDYDYQDGIVVVVYELDKKFDRDFKLIKEGLYSRTSEEFQKMFPKFIKVRRNGGYTDEVSVQFRIFNKTEDLRKYWQDKFDVEFDDSMEVWYTFSIEKESLTPEKLENYVQ